MDGDPLIVDRSLEAGHGSVVIAAAEGKLTVKHLTRKNRRVLLVPASDAYHEFDIIDQEDALIYG